VSTAILALFIISLVLCAAGAERSYDRASLAGPALIVIGVGVLLFTGVLSTGYVVWSLLT
jgi:hypothetical protein